MDWNERYRSENYVYGKSANDFLRLCEPHLKREAKILSIGEGEGRNASFLVEHGHFVKAIDGSQVAREKCLKLCEHRLDQLSYEVCDLRDYRPDGLYDAALAIWCHLEDSLRSKVHRRIVEHIVPGGLFILEAYRPEQLGFGTGGPKSEEMMLTIERIKDDLTGMQFLILQECVRDIHEGEGHLGTSATIQVLAKKMI